MTTSTVTYDDVVDLERYPLHDLASDRGRAVIADCRASLAESGISQLPGFVTDAAVAATLAMREELKIREWASESTHTVYFTPPDETVPADHPLRRQVRSAKRALAYDLIPVDAPLRRLYDHDDMTTFIAAVLGKDEFYRSADPLDCLEIATFPPGDELGWHFDNSEFSVTLMLQEPEAGGDFDYYPATRTDEDEHVDRVRALVDEDPTGRVRIDTAPGTLAVFHGHHALHRVTKVEGSRDRVNAVLTYGDRPGMRLSELTQMLFYGRNV